MTDERVPLYVRLPSAQAAALDRMVAATGVRKQRIVSELISDGLTLGRIDLREAPAPSPGEVLSLEEAAALLRVEPDEVRARIADGGLPARRFGDAWRIARVALMAWLAQGEPAPARTAGFGGGG